MYAIKQALVTAEHLEGNDLNQTIFNMDIRSHGKEFEQYYTNAQDKGVRFIKARPHSFLPGENNKGVVMTYFTDDGEQLTESFDMAVLSVGLEAPEDAKDLAGKFEIELDKYRFAQTTGFEPVMSTRQGVFVTGAFQGPKDIPQSVTEASSAACEAANLLSAAKGSLSKTKVYPEAYDISDQDPRIGVFVCSCGINIAGTIDVKALTEYATGMEGVVYAENNLFTCATDTQDLIASKIKEHQLNRIVIAACSPRTHEPLFQDTLREARLNGYLIEMANIRNQNSWVHQEHPEKATQKAKHQVRMAVARVGHNYPLNRLSVKVVQRALVIGGGISGMVSALGLAEQGYETVLVEKTAKLGGNAWSIARTWKDEPLRPMLYNLIEKVESHLGIQVYTNAKVTSCSGSVGNFTSTVEHEGEKSDINYGVAVMATGARESKPDEYLYGRDHRVMTQVEFDEFLSQDSSRVETAEGAVFIQCVGSRNDQRPYCSRICCTHSVKSAIRLKERNPEMNVFILHRDIRTYGAREELYRQARDMGVIFVRYTPERKPQVITQGKDIYVQAFDPVIGESLKIYTDYLVLASAIEPNDISDLSELYKCSLNSQGFINEAHPKLRPVDMSVDGLFLAGLCNYPKPVDEAIAQAKAAVSRAGAILARESMELDAIKSCVTEKCDGCALCVDVCPYRALSLEEYGVNGSSARRVAADPALCKGCGLCEATCPKDGVVVHGVTMKQLRAQVDAALVFDA